MFSEHQAALLQLKRECNEEVEKLQVRSSQKLKFIHNISNIKFKMKSSFPKRYKSILIVFMKMTFFYLDPYILLIFNLSC